jgi:alkylhydroperoxidase/carboxymuconolactone decarboxylase family protein YurZ
MLGKCKIKALEAILSMENEVLTDDLANGHRDLIALYVAMIADFAGFIRWQARQAAAAGVTPKELRESVRLGVDFSDKSGLVSASLTVALDNIEQLKDGAKKKGDTSG